MAKRLVNKSEFVRRQPADMSAAEIVAAAKKKGFKLSDKYVFNIRSKAKTASGGKKKKRKPGRPSKKDALIVRRDGDLSRDENVFADMALDMGLLRAEEVLRRLRNAIATALVAE